MRFSRPAAPSIFGIEELSVGETSVTIGWNTDYPATSRIQYGTTTDYDQATDFDGTLSTAHEQEITELSEGTTYHYRCVSQANGRTTYSTDNTFETGSAAACVISNVAESNVTTSSAQITWTTDLPATSQIKYGPTASYGSETTLNEELETSHSDIISGLDADTTYHYRVVSVANGQTTNGDDGTFATEASPEGDPELPRSTLDTTYSAPTGGTQRTPANSAELQYWFTNSGRGDVIILDADVTYTGPFTCPAKSGTGWIYVISDELASMAEGTRVTADAAIYMPKIVASGTSVALTVAEGASHWRFAGLEIASTNDDPDVPTITVVQIGNTEVPEDVTDSADYIFFDRCYIHGTETGNLIQGINVGCGRRIGVVECLINEIHSYSEAHGIQIYTGNGPYKIHNNRIEAAGINLFFGDNGGLEESFQPTDITVTSNTLYKPLTWKQTDPSYGGLAWKCKNNLEFKGGAWILAQGNVIEHSWTDGQVGYLVLMTPRSMDSHDITFRRNYLKNSEKGMQISPADQDGVVYDLDDILIEDNVFFGITSKVFNVSGTSPESINKLTIRHNTSVYESQSNAHLYFEEDHPAVVDFTFHDNIFEHATYGVAGSGMTPNVAPVCEYYCTAYDFDSNVVIGRSGLSPSQYTTNDYIRNFHYETSNAGVGFTNDSPTELAHLVLLNTSDYYQAGTDSEDIGADISAIQAAMSDSDAE